MTWKLLVGFIALMKKPGQLNVPELVEESNRDHMGMNANFVAIFESLENWLDLLDSNIIYRGKSRENRNGY